MKNKFKKRLEVLEANAPKAKDHLLYKLGFDDAIEKAVEWLEDNVNDYVFNDKSFPNERDWLKVKSELFGDLKQAMKGE